MDDPLRVETSDTVDNPIAELLAEGGQPAAEYLKHSFLAAAMRELYRASLMGRARRPKSPRRWARSSPLLPGLRRQSPALFRFGGLSNLPSPADTCHSTLS